MNFFEWFRFWKRVIVNVEFIAELLTPKNKFKIYTSIDIARNMIVFSRCFFTF